MKPISIMSILYCSLFLLLSITHHTINVVEGKKNDKNKNNKNKNNVHIQMMGGSVGLDEAARIGNGETSTITTIDLSALGDDLDFYDLNKFNIQLEENGDVQTLKRIVGDSDKGVPVHAESDDGRYSMDLTRVVVQTADDGSGGRTGGSPTVATTGVIVDYIEDRIIEILPNEFGEDTIRIRSGDSFNPEEDPVEEEEEENSTISPPIYAYEEAVMYVANGGGRQRRRNLREHHANEVEATSKTTNKDAIAAASASLPSELPRNLQQTVTLDVMVIWTKKAECKRSGKEFPCDLTEQTGSNIMALVNLGIAQTNTAFELSGINARVNLVHAYRHPDYVENDDGVSATNRAITNMRNARGGLEDVQRMRAQYGADMVHMIVNSGWACGTAFLGPGITAQYSSSDVDCAAAMYTMTHELGHSLGANHDRGAADACRDRQRTNYGFRDPQGRIRTMMSYPCRTDQCDSNSGGTCSRVLRFSSDGGEFNNIVLGDSSNNNVNNINRVVNEVSNYYQSDGSTGGGGGGGNGNGGGGGNPGLINTLAVVIDDTFNFFFGWLFN